MSGSSAAASVTCSPTRSATRSSPTATSLLYPIPALDGSVATGRRLANFVWYRNYAVGEELDDLMTDRYGTRRDLYPATGCGPRGAPG